MLRARISSRLTSFMYAPVPRRLTRQGRTEALYINHVKDNAYRVTSIGNVYSATATIKTMPISEPQQERRTYQKRDIYLKRY